MRWELTAMIVVMVVAPCSESTASEADCMLHSPYGRLRTLVYEAGGPAAIGPSSSDFAQVEQLVCDALSSEDRRVSGEVISYLGHGSIMRTWRIHEGRIRECLDATPKDAGRRIDLRFSELYGLPRAVKSNLVAACLRDEQWPRDDPSYQALSIAGKPGCRWWLAYEGLVELVPLLSEAGLPDRCPTDNTCLESVAYFTYQAELSYGDDDLADPLATALERLMEMPDDEFYRRTREDFDFSNAVVEITKGCRSSDLPQCLEYQAFLRRVAVFDMYREIPNRYDTLAEIGSPNRPTLCFCHYDFGPPRDYSSLLRSPTEPPSEPPQQ